jgi:NitT/TauT family transport system substrate-binding protein
MPELFARAAAAFALLVLVAIAPARADPEKIKIGLILNSAQAPIFLALEHGYFAAEGLEATLVPFDAGQPVAVAAAAGDVDIGSAGGTGGFYNLAGQGALRIIGGNSQEAPSFQMFGFVASPAAYAAGLTSAKNLSGHSVAVTQIGGGYHYALALLAEKYGVDLKAVRILPLQSISNIGSALAGGQTDFAVLNSTAVASLQQHGSLKLIAWSGDETPYQATVLFTPRHDADERGAMIARFLTAYRKGAHEYAAAFVGADGRRIDGPTAPAVTAIIAKYAGLTPEQISVGIAYDDPDARLDVKDILHQIAWFEAQGMVKGEFDPMSVIDTRYAIPLPSP